MLGRIWQLCLLFLCLWPVASKAIDFPLSPEIQGYYSGGNRQSSYLSLALGFSTTLNESVFAPKRSLQILGVFVPREIMGAGLKVSGWQTLDDGKGLEIGLNDQQVMNIGFKAASMSLKHLAWSRVKLGRIEDKLQTNALRLAFSNGQRWLTLVGLELVHIKSPIENIWELQLSLGFRYGS